jgi:hypothetical protein
MALARNISRVGAVKKSMDAPEEETALEEGQLP